MPASSHRCPKCSGREITRSRTRGPLERLARIVDMYPFRCVACYHRFFALGRR